MKFNKLCIYPIKGAAKHILYMTEYISNGKNPKIKLDLPFGIISFNSFFNIETMNVISSDVEVNEYELIGTKSDELVNAMKQLGLPHFFGFIRQLSLRDKLRSKNLDNEMILYLTINERKLDYINFKKFKDILLGLKEVMEEIGNTKDEFELKTWELIKIERKQTEEFIIEKGEELEQELLRARNRFFEDLIVLDKKQIKYETNKLQCDLSMKKRTKIDELEMVKTELKI